MPDLLFFLFLGHFCGDYAFQTDRMARHKRNSVISLTTHSLIYTLSLAAALVTGLALNKNDDLYSLITVYTLLAVFVTHWLQDYIRADKYGTSKQAYYLDQAIHIAVLFVIRILAYGG